MLKRQREGYFSMLEDDQTRHNFITLSHYWGMILITDAVTFEKILRLNFKY